MECIKNQKSSKPTEEEKLKLSVAPPRKLSMELHFMVYVKMLAVRCISMKTHKM